MQSGLGKRRITRAFPSQQDILGHHRRVDQVDVVAVLCGQPAGVDFFLNTDHAIYFHTCVQQSCKCCVSRNHPRLNIAIGELLQPLNALLKTGPWPYDTGMASLRWGTEQGFDPWVLLQQGFIGFYMVFVFDFKSGIKTKLASIIVHIHCGFY